MTSTLMVDDAELALACSSEELQADFTASFDETIERLPSRVRKSLVCFWKTQPQTVVRLVEYQGDMHSTDFGGQYVPDIREFRFVGKCFSDMRPEDKCEIIAHEIAHCLFTITNEPSHVNRPSDADERARNEIVQERLVWLLISSWGFGGKAGQDIESRRQIECGKLAIPRDWEIFLS